MLSKIFLDKATTSGKFDSKKDSEPTKFQHRPWAGVILDQD